MIIGLAMRGLDSIRAVVLNRLPLTNFNVGQLMAAMVPAWTDTGKIGLLWVLLSFAAFTGLAHSFVHEEEAGTSAALRLSMRPESVYAGKLAFNCVLLGAVAAAITPFYMVITGMSSGQTIWFLALMAAGCIGLGSSATIIAALAAKARASGALFGAIGLPVVTVFLVLLINAANTLYRPDAQAIDLVVLCGRSKR
jgi:heme exporter protein B